MKKVLSIVLCIVCLLGTISFVGCSKDKCIEGRINHLYTEDSSTATCTKKGTITYKCYYCSKVKIENDVLKEHEYPYSPTSTTATCTQYGIETYKCKNCSYIKTENVDAYGHDYEHRVCTRCKYSPLYFNMSFSLNSVGGIKTYIVIKNTGTKRIKYISFNCYLYNSVDDKVKDEIYGLYAIPVQLDGYFEISDESLQVMDGDIIGYCERCASIVVEEIKITYSDGSYEFVSNYYRYR